MKKQLLLLAFFSCILIASAQNLLIENVTIIDPATRTVRTGDLWVQDGRIEKSSARKLANYDGPRIDGTGKYLVPGFVEMHTHSYGNMGVGQEMEMIGTDGTARRMLYNGVTAFLDLHAPEPYIFELRRMQQNGEMRGAELLTAGSIFTAPGGHGTQYGFPAHLISTPEEARTEVAKFAKNNPDVLKLVYDNQWGMPTLDRPTLDALVEAAHAHDLTVVAHIGNWEDVRHTVEAGVEAVTHTPNDSMPDELVALMRERGTYTIPTLAVQAELANFAREPELLDAPLLVASTRPGFVDIYRDTSRLTGRIARFMQYQRMSQDDFYRGVAQWAEGGVPVMVGTDAGNPGVFQGYSVHREMALLAEAGMSPWEVLAAATTVPGEFFGRDWGVNRGDEARLVLLNDNPLDDIAHTQRIEAVIFDGKVVDRAALLDPLDNVRKRKLALIDSFETAEGWAVQTDEMQGGTSTLTLEANEGVARITGQLEPGAQGFAWANVGHQFANGLPRDVSDFAGVIVRYRLPKGVFSVSMVSKSVQDFDFHAHFLPPSQEWREMKLPFSAFQQRKADRQPWSGRDATGITFGAFAQQAVEVELEVDWVRFYRAE